MSTETNQKQDFLPENTLPENVLSKNTLLKVENLSISLPSRSERTLAVNNVNFKLNQSEILCIVGESGSGKSMIANSIMSLLPQGIEVINGKIWFDNKELVSLKEKEKVKLRGPEIAMIFQEPMTALNPLMTIENQLNESLIEHKIYKNKKQCSSKIDSMLLDVGLTDLKRIRKSYPFNLSGGQRQRVMIAMALSLSPKILIADEPTTALDVTTQAQILNLIKSLQNKYHMGVIFITHDFGVVADISDRIIVMEKGVMVEEGTHDNVLNNPEHSYTKMLISAVPHVTFKDTKIDNISEENNSQDIKAQSNDSKDNSILKIQNLCKSYATSSFSSLFKILLNKALHKKAPTNAVDNISFNINKNEIVGLVGESGSGKTTVGRCIVKLLSYNSGLISFQDTDIKQFIGKKNKNYCKNVQMIFQDPYASLNARHRVGDIIAEGPLILGLSRSESWKRAEKLLLEVGLPKESMKLYPHEFSGGQRQRIGIARALAVNPSLIIADEPVSALDVSVQAKVLDLLLKIKQKTGISMLFITHDLRVAAKLCDKIIVMNQGVAVEIGTTKEIFLNPKESYTKLLIDSIPGQKWNPVVSLSY